MERKLEIVAAMRCYIALEEQRTCGESKNFCRGAGRVAHARPEVGHRFLPAFQGTS